MKNEQDNLHEQTVYTIGKLQKLVTTMAVVIILLWISALWTYNKKDISTTSTSENITSKKEIPIEKTYSVDTYTEIPFDDNTEGKLAALGKQLVTETYALIGPESELKITGNHLSCTSCHLNGGTKSFAAPYIGVAGVFPTYIGRENIIESLEERINGCFDRSMNGKAIDVNSKTMRAIVTYIKHLSKNIPLGKRIEGQGFVDIKIPKRAADLKQGAILYQNTCAVCHKEDGQGMKGTKGNRAGGYVYPPLWGNDSYNDGAGMARLLTAAKFIKGNMPFGITHNNPTLTDEQAFDIAAFVNSHDRPKKANKELDYPDLSKKPMDCPYPPYKDAIAQEQHKYGPFDFAKKENKN